MRTTAANDNDAQGARPDDRRAFLPDPFARRWGEHPAPGGPLAEELVPAVTAGEETAPDPQDLLAPEELGGPFVVTRAETEYGDSVHPIDPPSGELPAPPKSRGSHRWFEALLRRMAREWD